MKIEVYLVFHIDKNFSTKSKKMSGEILALFLGK